MPDQLRSKINSAVRECLDRCYAHDDALVAVADYMAELRSRRDWNPSEVGQVHSTVLRMLQVIVARPD